MYVDGWLMIIYGICGLFYKEIILMLLNYDLYSGIFGGMVLNLVYELCEILVMLYDEDGWVMIFGFYMNVVDVLDEEWQVIVSLFFEWVEYLSDIGVIDLCGEVGYLINECCWIWLMLDVNGIISGF